MYSYPAVSDMDTCSPNHAEIHMTVDQGSSQILLTACIDNAVKVTRYGGYIRIGAYQD